MSGLMLKDYFVLIKKLSILFIIALIFAIISASEPIGMFFIILVFAMVPMQL